MSVSSMARPAHLPRLVVTLLALSALALQPGCAERNAPSGGNSPSGGNPRTGAALVPPPDPTVAVRRSPLYRQAQQDCRDGRYSQAAGLLERLASTPGLTPDQAAFCRAQRAICLRDAGVAVPAARPVSATAATVSVPLTPEQADCGPRALALACHTMGVKGADVAALRRVAGTTGRGTTMEGLALAAQSVGLKAKGEQVDLAALKRLSGPALAWVDGNHYLAVLSVDGDTATVHDPNHPREEDIPTAALLARSGGVLLTLTR